MEKLKTALVAVWKFVVRYPLAILGSIIVMALAIMYIGASGKMLQLGGILGWLWGSKKKDENIRVIPPSERVDKDGKLIPPGESDEEGYIQAGEVLKIVEPGIFSDPSVIEVKHPEKGNVKIPLPKGVSNKDIEQIIEVSPNVYQIANKDGGLSKDQIDNLLQNLKS